MVKPIMNLEDVEFDDTEKTASTLRGAAKSAITSEPRSGVLASDRARDDRNSRQPDVVA